MARKKKRWSKPKLIILVKGRPAEYALGNCKGVVTGPISAGANCLSSACSQVCNATANS